MFKKLRTGEIYFAELVKTGEHIQHGVRPVLIIGKNAENENSGFATVIPITSKIRKKCNIPTHVFLPNGLQKESVILPEQITTILKSQLESPCLYRLNHREFKNVKSAVKYQLGITL